ncbi:sugar-binding transcriptional regulator [Vagococcus salmoninarum]|uniref:sugar-binding transcriptional regulator n=1 Tax=Vagococcus salmoninarum TaxID=2739 RepID=UPI001881CDFA|nr:sugar-binding transcriptional regulator [Vagococcus salmoninarum]MBE9388762.1 sugar-binding transcriptional regulator [Vagococcus salmoninarum]
MAYSDDTRLLIEVAHMYYEEGAKQIEVAKKFNISRSLVSKYLSKARDIGLVEIIIHDEQLHPYRQLEERLKRVFGLKDVICISPTGETQLKRRLGSAAEKYLSRIIKPDSIVGISAGTSVKEVANAFSTNLQMPSVMFVPMVGGLGSDHTNFQANVICEMFAKQTGGLRKELHAPVVVDTEEAKKVFMDQSYIKDAFNLARQADIALLGIGGKPVYSTMTKYYFSEVDEEVIASESSVVGDICYNFINADGSLNDCEWNQRVLTLDLADLRKIPNVIAVSGGQEKLAGIYAAIKGGLIDILVTDATTAKALLKMKD